MIMRPCDCHVPTPHFVFAKKRTFGQAYSCPSSSYRIIYLQPSFWLNLLWRTSSIGRDGVAILDQLLLLTSVQQSNQSFPRGARSLAFVSHAMESSARRIIVSGPQKKSTPTAQPRRGVHNAKGKQMQIRASRELKFRLLACALFPRTAGRTEDDRAHPIVPKGHANTGPNDLWHANLCVLPSLSVNRED